MKRDTLRQSRCCNKPQRDLAASKSSDYWPERYWLDCLIFSDPHSPYLVKLGESRPVNLFSNECRRSDCYEENSAHSDGRGKMQRVSILLRSSVAFMH